MSESFIVMESLSHGITRLTLNRPDKRNALSIQLMRQLCAALDKAAKDEECRVVLLCGAGPVFCAGLDLQEASDTSCSHTSAEWVARTLEKLARLPLITIGAARGAAIAGGAGLLAACDITVVAQDLQLAYSEVRRGLVPALVMVLLRRQLADRDLRELVLLAEPIDGVRAQEMGLVTRTAPSEKVHEEAERLARTVLQGAPGALSRTKMLMEELLENDLEESLQRVLSYHLRARTSEEADEGIRAFLEKRQPSWQGGLLE